MKPIKKVILASCCTLGLLFAAAVGNTNQPSQPTIKTEHNLNTSGGSSSEGAEYNSPEVIEPTKETKFETERKAIAFDTIETKDANLARGTTRVVQEGKAGVQEYTYEVTYLDGIESNRQELSSRVVQEPVNKIIAVGTYVPPQQTAPKQQSITCQNGTYVNSAGQTICRPSSINTGGATAICKDGTYSYSKSRRGTCSHHGGVRSWL